MSARAANAAYCVANTAPTKASSPARIEIAPGVDLQRDILDQMGFTPLLGEVALMDARIFTDAPMGLKDDLLTIPLERRITWDDAREILFINLSRLAVRTPADIEAIRQRVARRQALRAATV